MKVQVTIIFLLVVIMIFCDSLLAIGTEKVEKTALKSHSTRQLKSNLVGSDGGKQESAEALLAKITKNYRTSGLIETSIQKVITYEWKPKEDISKGRFIYYKGRMRTEFSEPEKNWTIYNGKQWWNIQFASPDFPGKNKVTHTKIHAKDKEQYFLLRLIELTKPSDQFIITTAEDGIDQAVLNLESKEKAQGFSNIRIVLDKKKMAIKEISFKDDMGNRTTLKLGEPIRKKTANPGLFEYQINPKLDEVIEL